MWSAKSSSACGAGDDARPHPPSQRLCRGHLPDGRQPRCRRTLLGRADRTRDHSARRLPCVAFAAADAPVGPVRGHPRPRLRRGRRRPAPTARKPGSTGRSRTRWSRSTRWAGRIRSRCGRAASWPAASMASGIGTAFFGESMFSRATDASKVALAWLVARMKAGGFTLLDCQLMTEHLRSLGAIDVPREAYSALLAAAVGVGFGRRRGRSGRGRRLAPAGDFGALDALAGGCGRRRRAGPFGKAHFAAFDPDVIDRVLDHVERRRFLVQPAREHPPPALVAALDVDLDEAAGQPLILPRRGLFAGAQADDDIAPLGRLAGAQARRRGRCRCAC